MDAEHRPFGLMQLDVRSSNCCLPAIRAAYIACSFDLSRSHPLQKLLGEQHAVSLCLQAHFWGHVAMRGVRTTTVFGASGMPLLARGGTPACGKCRLGLAAVAAHAASCYMPFDLTVQQRQMQSCHNFTLPLTATD